MNDAAPPSGPPPLVFECDLDERPETVWRALTTPEIVAEWLGSNTMPPGSNGSFKVWLAPSDGGVVACEILEASPPNRLSYAWRVEAPMAPEGLDSVVTFTLTRNGEGGTHLQIVHRGIEHGAAVHQPATVMLAGKRCLGDLRPNVRGGSPARRGVAHTAPVRARPLTSLRRAA